MARKEKFGKLVLLEETGADHLAVTFRAARLGPSGLDRIVTLLRYTEAVSTHAVAPARLLDRARLAARLRIPGLLQVLGIGRVEQSYYTSFELMEGRTLRAVIDRARQEGFPFAADNSLMVASRAAAALESLHDKKDETGAALFHGLVKPSHLVVSWEGDVRLMGLGVWSALRDTDLLGADEKRYLAPEQAVGETGDARSDVYTLALVLLEMFTGLPPDGSDPLATLGAARYTTVTGEQEALPTPVAEILRSSLVPEPSSRYATIGEMRNAIDTLLFSGDFTPSTFNLAFFMHSLFRVDMEDEAVALAEASQADYTEYLPRPESPPSPAEPATQVSPSAEPSASVEAPAPTETPLSAEAPASAETPSAVETSVAAEAAISTEAPVAAAAQPPVVTEPHARSPDVSTVPIAADLVPGTASRDPSGSGRRARATGGKARGREGTAKLARAAATARRRRALGLVAGLGAVIGVVGALYYLDVVPRLPLGAGPSAATLSPDAAAALARVRELEARLAELEREKAAVEAAAERAAAEVADADAAERTRAEARRRARAERARREAEIRQLEDELRTAEQLLIEGQRGAASDVDFSSILPAVAAPPTPEPLPPPTTLPPVRPGDLVEAEDPAVTLPVFLSGRPVGYPPAAERLQREGTVVVEALVDETGTVTEVRVVEPSVPGMGFEAAAIRQVMSRRYRPATKDGVPVRIWIRIRVNFRL
jgi:serine/threonine-protein kinase